MSYVDQLRVRAREVSNIVCVGLDPVLEKIPIKEGNVEDRIVKFYVDILAVMINEKVIPAVVKPNAAYYEEHGEDGLRALKRVIEAYTAARIPVILDGKRADIGKSSAAYARGWFKTWNVDAMTVAPYMGGDSVSPFTDCCKEGKGVYVLVRTSNKGARDLQDLVVNGKPLYWHVANYVSGKWYEQGIGAVIGATYIEELEELSRLFVASGKPIPLLIPGVGDQGGSAQEVVRVLRETGNELAIHRINSSGGINYAYEKEPDPARRADYAGAAVRALQKLIKEIGPLE